MFFDVFQPHESPYKSIMQRARPNEAVVSEMVLPPFIGFLCGWVGQTHRLKCRDTLRNIKYKWHQLPSINHNFQDILVNVDEVSDVVTVPCSLGSLAPEVVPNRSSKIPRS